MAYDHKRACEVDEILADDDLSNEEKIAKLALLFPEFRDDFAYWKRKLDDAIFECEQNTLAQIEQFLHKKEII